MYANLLTTTLDRYQTSLDTLEQAPNPLAIAFILDTLYARDRLEQALCQTPYLTSDRLSHILALDKRLKHQAHRISQALALPDCRAALPSPPSTWWWHLETYVQPHHHDRWDWLIQGLTLLVWPFNLAFLLELTRRFLVGGPGIGGALAVATPILLTLLQANSQLTKTGQQAFTKLISKLGIPPHWQAEANLASTILLLVSLLLFWSRLPAISQRYNQRGLALYATGQLGSAEHAFQRAIALDENNTDAYFNLGDLYESLQEIPKAREHYQHAAQSQLPEAYNNLARLDIQAGNYADAVARLELGLQLLSQHPQTPVPAELLYSFYKNLGWARFQQGRDAEAVITLKTAIAVLEKNPDALPDIRNRGSAYCLLAQAQHRQGNPDLKFMWQQCCQWASRIDPDEDTWLHLAYTQLQILTPGQEPLTCTPIQDNKDVQPNKPA